MLKMYYENGQLKSEITYASDTIIKIKNYDENGKESYDSTATLRLDTFSSKDIPDSLSGAGCTYAATKQEYKKKRFILSFSLGAPHALVSVNHKLNILNELAANSHGDYANETYTITVETTNGKTTGEETFESTGKMTVKSKYGESATIDLYGECGD